MGTAAEFNRIAISDYAHLIAVFFAEESHGAHCLSFGDGNLAALVAGDGFADAFVGEAFNLRQFLGSYFLEVGEVEAERVGSHE